MASKRKKSRMYCSDFSKLEDDVDVDMDQNFSCKITSPQTKIGNLQPNLSTVNQLGNQTTDKEKEAKTETEIVAQNLSTLYQTDTSCKCVEKIPESETKTIETKIEQITGIIVDNALVNSEAVFPNAERFEDAQKRKENQIKKENDLKKETEKTTLKNETENTAIKNETEIKNEKEKGVQEIVTSGVKKFKRNQDVNLNDALILQVLESVFGANTIKSDDLTDLNRLPKHAKNKNKNGNRNKNRNLLNKVSDLKIERLKDSIKITDLSGSNRDLGKAQIKFVQSHPDTTLLKEQENVEDVTETEHSDNSENENTENTENDNDENENTDNTENENDENEDENDENEDDENENDEDYDDDDYEAGPRESQRQREFYDQEQEDDQDDQDQEQEEDQEDQEKEDEQYAEGNVDDDDVEILSDDLEESGPIEDTKNQSKDKQVILQKQNEKHDFKDNLIPNISQVQKSMIKPQINNMQNLQVGRPFSRRGDLRVDPFFGASFYSGQKNRGDFNHFQNTYTYESDTESKDKDYEVSSNSSASEASTRSNSSSSTSTTSSSSLRKSSKKRSISGLADNIEQLIDVDLALYKKISKRDKKLEYKYQTLIELFKTFRKRSRDFGPSKFKYYFENLLLQTTQLENTYHQLWLRQEAICTQVKETNDLLQLNQRDLQQKQDLESFDKLRTATKKRNPIFAAFITICFFSIIIYYVSSWFSK